jgi:hypothetical protein
MLLDMHHLKNDQAVEKGRCCGFLFVIPVKTGIQYRRKNPDSRFRGNDGKRNENGFSTVCWIIKVVPQQREFLA